jgi:hypothetical protein
MQEERSPATPLRGLEVGPALLFRLRLHRVAASRHVLHTRQSKSLNKLSYFDRFERLLICGFLGSIPRRLTSLRL